MVATPSPVSQHASPVLHSTVPADHECGLQQLRLHPVPALHRRCGDVLDVVHIHRVDQLWRLLDAVWRRHADAHAETTVWRQQLRSACANAAVQLTAVRVVSPHALCSAVLAPVAARDAPPSPTHSHHPHPTRHSDTCRYTTTTECTRKYFLGTLLIGRLLAAHSSGLGSAPLRPTLNLRSHSLNF